MRSIEKSPEAPVDAEGQEEGEVDSSMELANTQSQGIVDLAVRNDSLQSQVMGELDEAVLSEEERTGELSDAEEDGPPLHGQSQASSR